ncbi:MAG: hypothetical protein CL623_01920 [Arcobacter sp.]|nr:hypothetical protein [Arcobacter sp.]|tara:strand:+ start:3535 stop:3813 length:279 start_codon:yes stop_codon:yes gene_type:complete
MENINEFFKNKYPSNLSAESELKIFRTAEMLYKRHGKSLLKKPEIAQEIGISQSSIDRLRRSGELKYKRIGGQIFFTLFEVSYFIEEVCDGI